MKNAVNNFWNGEISRNDFLKVFVNSLKKRCFLNGEFPNLTNIIEHDTEKFLPDFSEYFPQIRTLGYLPLKYGTDDREHVALFAVTCAKDLSERSYRRKQFDFAQKIADLPGQIRIWFDKNHSYPGNAVFLFIAPDGKSFRLSLIERDKSKEKKIFKRYTFFVSQDQSNRTFFDRIGSGKKWETFSDLRDTFSVEKLSDDFFNAYKEYYQKFIDSAIIIDDDSKKIFADTGDKDKALRDYVKKMMGRLVFLQFLQKKGWLGVPEGAEWGNGDKEYLKNLFKNSSDKDNFLEAVLEKLFFDTLNQDRGTDAIADTVLSVNGGKVRIPYLNGGLFEKDKLDEAKVKFPLEFFAGLFDTFERYNFTIDENDPDDKEVGVDPEMLGRIFENLLEDNKDKGAFYTRKEVVQYMCEESLIAYIGDNEANRKLVKEFDAADITDAADLFAKLQDVKICDPAIGSGAFPMGMLNILYRVRLILENKEFAPENIVAVKKEIIQNNIYGVDIEAGAVDIARLRFWLSIVVDEDKPIPLPNLDYKIMQGNSLLEQYNGVDLSQICNFMPSEDTVKRSKRGKKQKDSDEATLLDLFDDTLCTPKIMNDAMDYYFSIKQHNLKEQYKERINGKVLNCIKSALKQDDIAVDWENKPFFLWHTYFWDVFSKKGGFDIVIGNPPYVSYGLRGVEKLSKNTQTILRSNYPNSAEYKISLYAIFMELGIRLCRKDGVHSFIVPDSFLLGTYFSKIRSYILTQSNILRISFFTTPVFNADVGFSTIYLLKKHDQIKQKTEIVKVSNLLQLNDVKINNHISQEEYFNNHRCKFYLFFSESDKKLVKKINQQSSFLENFISFASGLIGKNGQKSITGNVKKSALWKAGIPSGKFITKFCIIPSAFYINYDPTVIKSGYHNVDYSKHKILLRQTGDSLIAALDLHGLLALNNIHIGQCANHLTVKSLKALVCILNSKLMTWYYQTIALEKGRVMPQIDIDTIDKLPIKLPLNTDCLLSDLHDRLCVDYDKYSLEMNKYVYELYGLTAGEIAVVEASFEKPATKESKAEKGKKAASAAPIAADADDIDDEDR